MYNTYFQPYTPAMMQPLNASMPIQQIMQAAQQAPQPNMMPISNPQPMQQNMSSVAPQALPVRALFVTCKEEATAAQVPFDNTLTLFVDNTNGCIYTKQFDTDTGESNFNTYTLSGAHDKPNIVPKSKYVERSEFNACVTELQAAIDALTPQKGEKA